MHPEVAVSRRCCGIGESHRKRILYRTIQMIMSSSYQNSSVKRVSELDSRRARTARPATDRLANRWTALPHRARSVVAEHPCGLNQTGTDTGPVINAGSAPPQADGIVR